MYVPRTYGVDPDILCCIDSGICLGHPYHSMLGGRIGHSTDFQRRADNAIHRGDIYDDSSIVSRPSCLSASRPFPKTPLWIALTQVPMPPASA